MNETASLAAGGLPHWSFDDHNSPYLIGNRCRDCGEFHFPAIANCRKCLCNELEEIHFGREGKLYSYSIIHVSSMGFKAPYAIGYIDVDEGLRLFSLIGDWQEGELENGKHMELMITKIREDTGGSQSVGFTYRPKRD